MFMQHRFFGYGDTSLEFAHVVSRIYVDILCEIREKDCKVLWQYSLQISGIFGWREMQEF